MAELTVGHLNAAMSRVNNQLAELSNQQNQIQNSVGHVVDSQEATRSELSELRAEFDAYLLRDEMSKNLQLAETQLIQIRQTLDVEYGHHAQVRRHATGIVQGLDTGIVSQEIINSATEELMLATPRYWLAPALIALAAWISNDRDLAQRALRESIRRDHDKTSLFFALVLRRDQRTAATARWLQQYILRQDPKALSHEFIVILDAIATGALGPEAKPVLMEEMEAWYEKLSADPTIVAAQVSRWGELIRQMRSPIDPRFSVLPKVSPTWPALKQMYEDATIHGNAHRHFAAIFEGPITSSPDLRERVDDILDSLVKNFDAEEAPHRACEAECLAVIEYSGNKVAAKVKLDAQKSVHDTSVDFLTLVTDAAFFPKDSGASAGTQRLAIALARDWVIRADGELEASNLDTVPDAVALQIDGWAGKIDGKMTESSLEGSLALHIDQETAKAVEQIKFGNSDIAKSAIAGVFAVIAIVGFGSGSVGLGVVMLIIAAVVGAHSFMQYRTLPTRREAARVAGERRLALAKEQLHGAIAEAVDLQTLWQDEAAKAAELTTFMASLNAAAFSERTPTVGREVMR